MKEHDPQKLKKLKELVDKPPLNYPWDDPEESKVFWQEFRQRTGYDPIYTSRIWSIPPISWLNDLTTYIASEDLIYRLRSNPQKLRRYKGYLDREDFPWNNARMSRIFWRVYRRQMGLQAENAT